MALSESSDLEMKRGAWQALSHVFSQAANTDACPSKLPRAPLKWTVQGGREDTVQDGIRAVVGVGSRQSGRGRSRQSGRASPGGSTGGGLHR